MRKSLSAIALLLSLAIPVAACAHGASIKNSQFDIPYCTAVCTVGQVPFYNATGGCWDCSPVSGVAGIWFDGAFGWYNPTEATIVGADAAFTQADGGIGDLNVTDDLEIDGDRIYLPSASASRVTSGAGSYINFDPTIQQITVSSGTQALEGYLQLSARGAAAGTPGIYMNVYRDAAPGPTTQTAAGLEWNTFFLDGAALLLDLRNGGSIVAGTDNADGSDDLTLTMCGGGAASVTRGALFSLEGNDIALGGSGGRASFWTGDDADGMIGFYTSVAAQSIVFDVYDAAGVLNDYIFTMAEDAAYFSTTEATDTFELRDGVGFVMEGSTSGTLTHEVAATTTNYTLTWPAAAAGAANYALLDTTGAGALGWVAGSTLGPWAAGTNGLYYNGDGVIVGADAAWSGADGAAGDLKLDDDLEIAGADVYLTQAGSVNVYSSSTSGTLTIAKEVGTGDASIAFQGSNGGVTITAGNNGAVYGPILLTTPVASQSIYLHAEGGATDTELVVTSGGVQIDAEASDSLDLNGGVALKMGGSTSGTLTHEVAAAVTDYTLTWPGAVAAGANYALADTDGAGTLGWVDTTTLVAYPPRRFFFDAQSLNPLVPAAGAEPVVISDTNYGFSALAYDDDIDECAAGKLSVPAEVDSAGTVTFRIYVMANTAAANDIIMDFRHAAIASGEDFDVAFTVESSGAKTMTADQDDLVMFEWTETINNLVWAADDLVNFQLCKDADNVSDDLSLDLYLVSLEVDIPVVSP